MNTCVTPSVSCAPAPACTTSVTTCAPAPVTTCATVTMVPMKSCWLNLMFFVVLWLFIFALLLAFRPSWVLVGSCDDKCCDRYKNCDPCEQHPTDFGKALGWSLLIAVVIAIIVAIFCSCCR